VSDGVESSSNVLQVVGVETSNGNTAIHGHVNGVLLTDLVDLVLVESSESEHTNLAGNVIPVVFVSESDESGLQANSHVVHAGGHEAEVSVPHFGELLISEDDVDNAGSMDGRVGVDRSGNLLDARVDDVTLSLAAADNGEESGTLTIETEVLGKRLEEHDVVGVLLEQVKGVGIFGKISTSKALVSTIETAEKLLSLDDFENSLPLLGSGVNTGRVVSTDVEQSERVVFAVVQVLAHASEVKSLSLGVEVTVGFVTVTNNLGKSSVDGPGLGGNHDINVFVRIPVGKEGHAETEGSSSGDRLGSSDSVLNEGLRFTEGKLLGFVDEGVNTLDSGVLVIHIVSENFFFGHADARENVRLVVVVTVSTHSEENLLGVSVLLELVVESENGISGGVGKSSPGGESSSMYE